MENYFKKPGLSFHQLKDFADVGPAYYHGRHVTKTIDGHSSGSMDLGNCVRLLVLEGPDAFAKGTAILPDAFLTPSGAASIKKEAQEWIATARAAGLKVITKEQADLCHRLYVNIYKHPTSSALLTSSENEVELSHQLNWNGHQIAVKAKIGIIDSANYVWDLKTIRNLDDVREHVKKYRYVEQLCWYSFLLTLSKNSEYNVGGMIFAETEGQERILIVEASADALEVARNRNEQWLNDFVDCLDSGMWPNDPSCPIVINSADIL
jgi:hypothetical protein